MHTLPYNDYGHAMRQRFGGRVQKLAIDAGLSCPNRDGSIGYGGCTFCLNEAFSPSYCRTQPSITEQIEAAIKFHTSRGRTADRYIAYFQAGTNTHAPLLKLKDIYSEALSLPHISGLIIGTRPDCISSEILDYLEELSHDKYIAIEYGIESIYDTTLQHVNRGHNFATAREAITTTRARGIETGAHFILGLPGESEQMILDSIAIINTLGINTVKFHQLQIYRGTVIERDYSSHPENYLFNKEYKAERYAELLCNILRRLDPSIAVERFVSQAPRHLISHSPLGGIRPDSIRNMVVDLMHSLGAKQGDML